MVSPEIRPVRIDNTLGVMTRCECAVTAANGGHVDDFVFVGKEGHKVWTARPFSSEDVGT